MKNSSPIHITAGVVRMCGAFRSTVRNRSKPLSILSICWSNHNTIMFPSEAVILKIQRWCCHHCQSSEVPNHWLILVRDEERVGNGWTHWYELLDIRISRILKKDGGRRPPYPRGLTALDAEALRQLPNKTFIWIRLFKEIFWFPLS